MGEGYIGQYFQRHIPTDQYVAAYLDALPPMSPGSLRNIRWALKWFTIGAPTVVLDGHAIVRWLSRQDLAPQSMQTIYDKTRAWYKWMSQTYSGTNELPDLGPVQFGRRNRGEKRGRKKIQ